MPSRKRKRANIGNRGGYVIVSGRVCHGNTIDTVQELHRLELLDECGTFTQTRTIDVEDEGQASEGDGDEAEERATPEQAKGPWSALKVR